MATGLIAAKTYTIISIPFVREKEEINEQESESIELSYVDRNSLEDYYTEVHC